MSTVESKCSVCGETDVTTKIPNHLKPSEVTLIQQKLPQTTQKLPKTTSTNGTPHHITTQRAIKSYLVFLLLNLNMIS